MRQKELLDYLPYLDEGVVLTLEGVTIYRQRDGLFLVEGAGPLTRHQAVDEILRWTRMRRPRPAQRVPAA